MPDPVDPSKTLLYSDTDFQDKIYRTGFLIITILKFQVERKRLPLIWD